MPSRNSTRYSLSASVRNSLRRVAWPRQQTSTPAAPGSSVPVWPTRRSPLSRRTTSTTSCDVIPGGLSTQSTPSIGRRLTRGGGPELPLHDLECLPDDLVERPTAGKAGGRRVAAAAERLCDRIGAHRAPRAEADANPVGIFLEQHRHVDPGDCAQRAHDP